MTLMQNGTNFYVFEFFPILHSPYCYYYCFYFFLFFYFFFAFRRRKIRWRWGMGANCVRTFEDIINFRRAE